MNAQELTLEQMSRNNNLKYGKILLIIFACLYVVAGIVFGIGYLQDALQDTPTYAIIGGCMAAAGMILWMAGLILLIMGLRGRKVFKNFIEENGEDALMNEVYNETLFIYARKGQPITVITRKHIFDIGNNIFNTAEVDHAYGYRYKNSTSIAAYTIDNKRFAFANGINLNSDDKTNIFKALQVVNPSVLLGFTNEALKEHRKRVKEYKASRKL